MAGFPPETVAFLAAVRQHNDREWFQEHREEYEAGYVEPAKAFADAALDELRTIAPGVQGEPRINGSIFRINHDARFHGGDQLYKDHLDLWFWEGGDRREAVSGFFLRLTPEDVVIGVGAHRFDRARLDAYRRAVAHPRAGACLVDITKELARKGFEVQGEHYARTPRGYDLSGERDRLIRFNALWADEQVSHPSILHTRRFLRWCTARWTKLAELHRWLIDEVA